MVNARTPPEVLEAGAVCSNLGLDRSPDQKRGRNLIGQTLTGSVSDVGLQYESILILPLALTKHGVRVHSEPAHRREAYDEFD